MGLSGNNADIATEQVAAERTALANERSALAARLAEAEAALQTSREESAALRRLQLELQSRHPEVTRAVEAAVRKEQAQQEDRNRKVGARRQRPLLHIGLAPSPRYAKHIPGQS